MYILFLSILFSCRETTPALQTLQPPSVLEEEAKATKTASSPSQRVYSKASNIYIDLFYLGGRSYSSSQGIIGEQFGDLLEFSELPMGLGRVYQYEKGSIQVWNDQIYMFRIPLPRLMRRSEAFQQLGFPEQIDKYLITHREYMVEHQWEFKRFRLFRDSKENELVKEVEAWKFHPKDQG